MRDLLSRGASVGRLAAFGLAFLLAALAVPLAPGTAVAAEVHVFDPALSLVGNCGPSAGDEVPDPGCPAGAHPPKSGFSSPCGVATDRHGYIYVASGAQTIPPDKVTGESSGRIDVFDADGNFVLDLPSKFQPCDIAVDSAGNLYVAYYQQVGIVHDPIFEVDRPVFAVDRLAPDSFPPTASTKYTAADRFEFVQKTGSDLCAKPASVAVDPSNDHLYIGHKCRVEEYESAAGGSALIEEEATAPAPGFDFSGIDVFAGNHDLYVAGRQGVAGPQRLFVFDGSDEHLKLEIDGSTTKAGSFDDVLGSGVAVDQSTGEVYVDDTASHGVVAVFDVAGNLVAELPKDPSEPKPEQPQPFAGIAVDAPFAGQVGYGSPNEGEVYLGSGVSSNKSRLLAFERAVQAGPQIRGQVAAAVTETEAILRGQVAPDALPTHYHFEYTTEAQFEVEGFAGAAAVPVPDGNAGGGGSFVSAAQSIGGLQPGTAYRFRLVATNDECTTAGEGVLETANPPCAEGPDARFTTYPIESGLADGRAYELVTPVNTNGRVPTMSEQGGIANSSFVTSLAALDGESLLFGTEGGSLPGLEGGGFHDVYEARRGDNGWQSGFVGLSGAQAAKVYFGGASADHQAAFWTASGGSFADGAYIRRAGPALDPSCAPPSEPSGHFELIGCGTLAHLTEAQGRWISPGGQHAIFITKTGPQLVPGAPPAGTDAVYDRTADGVTHVASLLPGNVTPANGQDAAYGGASSDGSAVAFEIGGTLFVRLDNALTRQVATGDPDFGGLSEDGGRLFYLERNPGTPELPGTEIPQGEIFAFDTATGAVHPLSSGDEAVLVGVSGDGSHAYFVSPDLLDGAAGEPGGSNLYVWDGSTVSFVATLDPVDVVGEEITAGVRADGLGLWIPYAASTEPTRTRAAGAVPMRSTANGSALVFQSRADLSPYESAGHSQLYRYAEGDGLTCISCNPTGAAAISDARLQTNIYASLFSIPPVTTLARIANLSEDGATVFFESGDPLVPRDTDGRQDVYEWRAPGAGQCTRQAGCLHLISGGRSEEDDYLYGVSPDGKDVFFLSGDRLVSLDTDPTPSIYDARAPHVPGEEVGFNPPSPGPPPCRADACQGSPGAQPGPLSPLGKVAGKGNVHRKRCRPGGRSAQRSGGGKGRRCRGKHRRHDHHRRGHKRGDSRGAGR